MKDDSLQCAKCDRRSVLYQETDGSFVCGKCLSDEIVDRYQGFREALALSLERSERMTAINAQKAAKVGEQ
jgi:ribosomal protein S27AE